MSNLEVEFIKSTIVTGTPTTSSFLVAELNKKKVGIPIYTFDMTSPIDIDFIDISTNVDLVIDKAMLVDSATSYNAGVSLMINSSSFAWPIYKISQENDPVLIPMLNTPSLVSDLIPTNQYVITSINKQLYGIPLYEYHSEYPFTTAGVSMSALGSPTTVVRKSKVKDISHLDPSTNLNSRITTYSQLIQRIKTQIGHPVINIEVCDDSQICDFIDIAIEWYTKYAGYTEEYLIFSSELYTEPGLRLDKLFSLTPTMRTTFASNASGGWDYDLGDYRKVAGIFDFQPGESTGINTLFTLEQAMAQQTYFSYMLGNAGFDLVTWEVLKQWLDLRTKVLAQTYYVDFDENRQLLRLVPPPNKNSRFYGIVGCWVEKPIAHLLREQWIQKYALALTKIAVGNVRGKYQGMQMFGGGILNYNDLLSQGLKEKEELEKQIQEGEWYDTAPPRFFLGSLAALLIPAGLAASHIIHCMTQFL